MIPGLKHPKDMPHLLARYTREEKARKRVRRYLRKASDADVQRIYNECLAAGRRACANLAAIEAGERLTKRALTTVSGFDPTIARRVMAEMDADYKLAVGQHLAKHNERRKRDRHSQQHASRSAPSGASDGRMEALG